MKTALKTLSVLVILGIALAFSPLADELSIGAGIPKPDLKLKDVLTGKDVTLNTAKTAKGLLVIFSCNTCPYVKLSEGRIKDAQTFCKANGVGIVVVNSNEGQRDGDDSADEMKKYGASQAFTAPYVLDIKSELADAFGASRTPQCFLFDASGALIYKGAIDDNVKDAKTATKHYLNDALSALMKGLKPEVKETKSIGCTIKRVE